jgi:hypothetical protein
MAWEVFQKQNIRTQDSIIFFLEKTRASTSDKLDSTAQCVLMTSMLYPFITYYNIFRQRVKK